MNNIQPGYIIAARDKTQDNGLWFILYADDEGILAIDLTKEHPDIPYRQFESALNIVDMKPVTEKLVLLGGPERSDDALVILHEAGAGNEDSHPINDDFAFMSYNYVLVPGHVPTVTTPDNKPSTIRMKTNAAFIVVMGYRIFDTPALMKEISEKNWLCLPASADAIFGTSRHDRQAKILKQVN